MGCRAGPPAARPHTPARTRCSLLQVGSYNQSVSTAFVGPSPERKAAAAAAGTPPILLMHGFDSSGLEFRRLYPLLADAAETWALDLVSRRGGGGWWHWPRARTSCSAGQQRRRGASPLAAHAPPPPPAPRPPHPRALQLGWGFNDHSVFTQQPELLLTPTQRREHLYNFWKVGVSRAPGGGGGGGSGSGVS